MKFDPKPMNSKITSLSRRLNKPKLTVILCGFLLLILLFVAAGHRVFAPSENLFGQPAKGSYIDLMKNQDWSHFAGSSQESQGLTIQPLGRAIVNQNGSPNQTNPPVNVCGPHLSVNGKFKVSASMQQIPKTGVASFDLYAT